MLFSIVISASKHKIWCNIHFIAWRESAECESWWPVQTDKWIGAGVSQTKSCRRYLSSGLQRACSLDKGGGRKSTQWFQIGFANRLWLILPEVCRKTTSWMKFPRTWWKINWKADKLLTERITFPWHWNFLNESECNYVAGKHQLTKCVCVCNFFLSRVDLFLILSSLTLKIWGSFLHISSWVFEAAWTSGVVFAAESCYVCVSLELDSGLFPSQGIADGELVFWVLCFLLCRR